MPNFSFRLTPVKEHQLVKDMEQEKMNFLMEIFTRGNMLWGNDTELEIILGSSQKLSIPENMSIIYEMGKELFAILMVEGIKVKNQYKKKSKLVNLKKYS